jgi:hypothetical protein
MEVRDKESRFQSRSKKMKSFITALLSFWKGVFSEADGTPSASRVIMFILSIVVSYCLIILVRAMVGMDAARAGLFLTAFPYVVGALALLITAPYAVNKGSGALTDILQMFKKG